MNRLEQCKKKLEEYWAEAERHAQNEINNGKHTLCFFCKHFKEKENIDYDDGQFYPMTCVNFILDEKEYSKICDEYFEKLIQNIRLVDLL